MTIGFKVDPNIKSMSCCVEMFDAGRSTISIKFENLADVLGGSTVCVSCLDDSDLDTFEAC